MRERRTYATTGDRIILDVTVNDTPMGQRAEYAETRAVSGRAIGTAPIASITLLKNDEPIWSETYGLDAGGGRPADVEEWLLSFTSDATPRHPGDAPRGWRHWRGDLRVRGAALTGVTATDFVNPTTQALEPEGNGARFATHTRGDASSIRLTLTDIRPDASLLINLDAARETGSAPPFFRPPADIEAEEVRLPLHTSGITRTLPAEGYPDDRIMLRRLIRNGPRDVTFSYTDEDEPRQGDYYYVRVVQVNDAMAWSSPVWVGGYPSR